MKFLVSACIAVGLFWFYLISSTFSTPTMFFLKWISPQRSAYMVEDGNKVKQKFVPLDRISKNLQNAVVIAEDDRFFEHEGIDPKAIREAIKRDWKKKKFAYGASTISMQLARNLYLSPSKSVFRKLKEMMIALKLERTLSKKRILELYLNYAQFGCGVFGAEAGAKHYFGGSARDLDRYQAAFLASVLPKPCYYDKRRGSGYLARRIELIQSRI